MIPKLHAKGTSFKGAAAYLLHDPGRATTRERVAWVETRNLGTRDGDVAWRVMAATAMDRARLKQQAGIKRTGQKSEAAVLHLSLSWDPSEAPTLTRDEMRRAVTGALRALGADDRQALVICHRDTTHPHVHVLLNRVSTEDGRMLSSSHEKTALSRWAQSYQAERGQNFCPRRAVNNAARDRGEYTRGQKDKARNVYELEAPHARRPEAAALALAQRRKAATLARRHREMRARHATEWANLATRHRRQRETILTDAGRARAAAITKIRREYRPTWEALDRSTRAELGAFTAREQHLPGRVRNALRALDFGAIFRSENPRAAISRTFKSFADAGARLEAFRKTQERRAAQLLRRQRRAERSAAEPVKANQAVQLAAARAQFSTERTALLDAQRGENAQARVDWNAWRKERAAAWAQLSREALPPPADDRLAKARALSEAAKAFARAHGRGRGVKRERGIGD